MQYIYTIEYFSAVKKNEIIKFARKWMKLSDYIGRGNTDPQRQTPHVLSYPCLVASNPQM